jgi:hypothetical protein
MKKRYMILHETAHPMVLERDGWLRSSAVARRNTAKLDIDEMPARRAAEVAPCNGSPMSWSAPRIRPASPAASIRPTSARDWFARRHDPECGTGVTARQNGHPQMILAKTGRSAHYE